jgi:UDP-glucose/iron transport system ATP-binding protein
VKNTYGLVCLRIGTCGHKPKPPGENLTRALTRLRYVHVCSGRESSSRRNPTLNPQQHPGWATLRHRFKLALLPAGSSLTTNAAVLEARDLSRTLDQPGGPKSLLRDVSFRLDQGQVLAVLGPSGAGKSTLLRMLNRLDEPSSGAVLLQGADTRTMDPRALRRRVGMVMQQAYLFPGAAAANVRYGPAQRGIVLQDAQVTDLIQQVGMAGYEDRDVATLSGGEAQRISIARALANQPEVLLLDEPTSALDDISKQEIEHLLASLVRERNMTCVWVTHDVAQARRVADLVLKLEAGQAIGFGTSQELLHA